MDVDQAFAQLSHQAERNGGVVDEGTAFACGSQLAADDGVVGVIVDIVLSEEALHVVSRQVEVCLDGASVASCLDGLGVGSVAEQQTDGTQDDALACTCLARDDGEAWMQLDVELVDECKVLDV